MQKNYTIFEKRTFTYKWIIKDFYNYLNYTKCLDYDYELASPNFQSDPNSNVQFRLWLKIGNWDHSPNPDNKWLSYFAVRNENKPTEKMNFHLYLLNAEDKEFGYSFLSGSPNSPSQVIAGCMKFFPLERLLNESAQLLPNDTLTLGCDVTTYEEPVNVSFECTQKPLYNKFQLMKNQLKELLQSESCSDFAFNINNKVFKAHKTILRARSPVFAAMFDNEMLEKHTNQTTVEDIRPEIFKVMLEFIYCTEIDVKSLSDEDMMELLAAADKYRLEDLKDICGEHLLNAVTVKNAMRILLLAELYNIEELIRHIKNFIGVNTKETLKTIDPEYFVKNGHHANMFIFKK